jgi:hypothetical protein
MKGNRFRLLKQYINSGDAEVPPRRDVPPNTSPGNGSWVNLTVKLTLGIRLACIAIPCSVYIHRRLFVRGSIWESLPGRYRGWGPYRGSNQAG